MAVIEIRVPDIGDFAEVSVIEVLVAAGETIRADTLYMLRGGQVVEVKS